ncbi:hypothetical protein HMN09_00773900 [Mycena chlorophos]|uniref:Uncharacterized protein n=1 Tax=Mycena chlorophos TaxID=658473 RepID=A0A8H6SVR4_MYCCL|nr:hypothetical protein HMN09_00773900 [Mycena chlorophos]
MYASLVRRSMHGLVPPKIATPKLVSGDSAGPLGPLVSFYSKLPKGPAPVKASGIKGRWFRGKNASAKPVLVLIGGLWLVGYTLDYQRTWSIRGFSKHQLTGLPLALQSISSTTKTTRIRRRASAGHCRRHHGPVAFVYLRIPIPFPSHSIPRPTAPTPASFPFLGIAWCLRHKRRTDDGRARPSREEAEEHPLIAGVLVAKIHEPMN